MNIRNERHASLLQKAETILSTEISLYYGLDASREEKTKLFHQNNSVTSRIAHNLRCMESVYELDNQEKNVDLFPSNTQKGTVSDFLGTITREQISEQVETLLADADMIIPSRDTYLADDLTLENVKCNIYGFLQNIENIIKYRGSIPYSSLRPLKNLLVTSDKSFYGLDRYAMNESIYIMLKNFVDHENSLHEKIVSMVRLLLVAERFYCDEFAENLYRLVEGNLT